MENKQDVNHNLISAVHNGNLERVREMVDKYGLSYSQAWSNGYVLLRDALERNHMSIAKLLLTKHAKVNSTNKCTDTPLHYAVKHNNIRVIQMIISRGGHINAQDLFGRTPLYKAIENRKVEITELLLKHGADVNVMDNSSTSPLHVAVENGCIEIIKLLLNSGANVDVKGEDDITPLHIAAQKGYEDIAEVLLNHSACILSSTLSEERLPLHFACERGNENIVMLFLNRGVDINATANDKSTPLHCAVRAGRTAIVKLLLENGANINHEDNGGRTVLNLAVYCRKASIVDYILKYSPDINNQSNRNSLKTAVLLPKDTWSDDKDDKRVVELLFDYVFKMHPDDANDSELLDAAVKKGYYNIVKCLLEYAPNGNLVNNSINGSTLLHTAVKNKHEEIASLLIRYGADVNGLNDYRNIPLFYSIQNVDLKISQLLLNNGANVRDNPQLLLLAVRSSVEIVTAILNHDVDINTVDIEGKTALHLTADGYHINDSGIIAKLLLNKGANVDATDKHKETPLHIAIKNRNVTVFKILLDFNANIYYGVENNLFSLHLAAETRSYEILSILLSKGVDVNTGTKYGYTALHLAIIKGHVKVVNILLEHGANVEQLTESGVTPLHLAAERNRCGIIESLLKFGANINCRSINDGKTVLHIASEKAFGNLVSFLLRNGSDINIACSNNLVPVDYALKHLGWGHSYSTGATDTDIVVTFGAFKRHIIKLKSASFFVSEKNLARDVEGLFLFESLENTLYSYQLMCEEEVANMKTEMLSANISFYDIIKKDASSLAIPYMRNDKIVQVLKSNEYKDTFPIYATMIERNFRRALEKKELLERAYTMIKCLFKDLPVLPLYCTEEILSYLSNGDLQVLLNLFKS